MTRGFLLDYHRLQLVCTGQHYPRVTIHALPDNILLEIFKFYVDEASGVAEWPDNAWHTPVHVCQRWRFVVLASPRWLDLHIFCTNKNQVENHLNIWPQLPLSIHAFPDYDSDTDTPLPLLGVTNIIAALKHHHRLGKFTIYGIPNSLLKEFGAMENPFPVLTELKLQSDEAYPLVLPDSFLLGAAPRLRTLWLDKIPFPALPKLLLSSRDLVELHLKHVPPSGYISPEALATSLSVLTRLESLELSPQFLPSWADRANPQPPRSTRVVLPSLTDFHFNGHSEYLECIVSQIDCPLLSSTWIRFSDQLASDTPQIRHFISRTEAFKAPHRADIEFSKDSVRVVLFRRKGLVDCKKLELQISCNRSSWQISAITDVCTSPLPPLPTLECLGICEGKYHKPEWQDNIVNTQWLQLFHPFSSVKNLFPSERLAQLVAPALQELIGGRVTEVLPALQNIFLQGERPSETVQEDIGQFIAKRQLSDCPVAVHCERNWWW